MFFCKNLFIVLMICIHAVGYYSNAQMSSSFGADTLAASQYWNKAQNSFMDGKFDSALLHYKKASVFYEQLLDNKDAGKWAERLILCYIMPAYIHYDKGEYEPSLRLSRLALDVAISYYPKDHVMMGNVQISFGYGYHAKADYDSALIYYTKAKDVFLNTLGENHNKVAFAYNSMGTIAIAKGDMKLAEGHFVSALGIWEKNYGESHSRVGTALNNLGIVYLNMGAYEKANEFYERSIEVKKDTRITDYRSLASSYFNIANNYALANNLEMAFSYYFKAKEFYFKVYNGESLLITKIYDGIGKSYAQKNQIDSAFIYFDQSLQYKMATLQQQHPQIAQSYAYMGQVYLKKEDYSKALNFYEKALSIYMRTYGKHQNIADYYNNIGRSLAKLNKNKDANSAFDKAIKANVIADSSKSIYESGVLVNDYYSMNILVNTLHNKANLLSNSDGIAEKRLGINTFLVCDSIIFRIQSRYLKQQDLLTFSKNINGFYSDAIKHVYNAKSVFEFGKVANHSIDELAFHFIERNKSVSLFINSKQAEAKYTAGIPDAIKNRENSLKAQRSAIVQKLNEDPEKRFSNSTLLFKINREYDSLIEFCQRTYPEYYALMRGTDFISLNQIRSFLPENASVLEYFLSDSSIYTLVISSNKVTTKISPLPDSIFSLIKRMNTGIEIQDDRMYIENSHQLFTSIIDPVYDEIKGKKLFIIPDGQFWKINFDLLLTNLPDSKTYEDFDYLIKFHDISYGHSANLLFNDKRKMMNQNARLLAFSYGDGDVMGSQLSLNRFRDQAMSDLPGSRREIKLISEIFDGDYFYGSYASEENFKENASNYSILHLAVHGQVSNSHPDDSKLFFTPKNDSLEDGFLYTHELYNMKLNAELAVLSACETGSGKVEPGEGIMSLGRAFSYAGVKSLLLARRKVSDDVTANIMESFYREIKNGKSKSEALRFAKLNYLENAPTPAAHPLFWGSFYILGDDRPFVFNYNGLGYIIGIVVVTLLALCLFFLLNYRNDSKISRA